MIAECADIPGIDEETEIDLLSGEDLEGESLDADSLPLPPSDPEPPRPQYDPLPDPISDIEKWLIEYRLRLHHAVLTGRNRARDKAILTTMTLSMQNQKSQVFIASVRWLVIHGAMYDQAVQKALSSLRESGYIRRHIYSGPKDTQYSKDGRNKAYAYSLMLDALPPAPEGAAMPETNLAKAVEGDFESPAFAGHKGFNARRRAIYLWLRDHQGSTAYAAHMALGMKHKTIKGHVDWLVQNRLVRVGEDGSIKALSGGRENATLADISDRNYLHEKNARRIANATLGWHNAAIIAELDKKAAKRKWDEVDSRITSAADLDFSEQVLTGRKA